MKKSMLLNSNEKKKKIIALILSGTIAITGGTLVGKYIKSKKELGSYQYGYTDINKNYNTKVKKGNFVLLDVGDNNSLSINDFFDDPEKDIKYCNEKDISAGIIISSNAKTQDDIYNDVNYAKSYVDKYKIDFPVFLQIDNIVESEQLKPNDKILLIKDFLDKCTSNGMYVGICGKDSNLCNLKDISEIDNNLNLDDYVIYLVKDNDKVNFDGNYHFESTEGDKNINNNAGYDFKQIMNENKLNSKERFLNDTIYEVQENDDLVKIANMAGLSYKELLDYNKIKKTNLKPGMEIKIPSSVDKNLPILSDFTYEELTKPVMGIDISEHQKNDETTDWKKINENFDFVILRSNNGTTLDNKFDKFYEECINSNLSVGAYCYNACKSNDSFDAFKASVKKQSNFTISCLRNKNFTYPIYLDIEPTSVAEEFTTQEVDFLLKDWQEKVINYGGKPGIYCNKSTYNTLIRKVSDKSLLDSFEIWIAGGKYYNPNVNYQLKDFELPEDNTYVYNGETVTPSMIQITSSAVNTGIGNDYGHVDVNLCYTNYEGTIKYVDSNQNLNSYTDYDFVRDKKRTASEVGFLGFLGAACVSSSYCFFKNKKNKLNKKC